MSVQIADTVRFRIVIPTHVLASIGCGHEYQGSPQPDTCRPCSVSVALLECDEMQVWWGNDGEGNRVISGRAKRDNKESLAITRLLAFARGDHEPLTLLDKQ